MDEIIKSLDNIADAINGNALTTCLSIIFAVVPIVLTIITIVLSVRMDKQNQKLQKSISDRDTINQTRQCVLDIYNAYLDAFHLTGQTNGNVADIFVSDQSYYMWANDIDNKSKAVMYAYNRAKLMLNDPQLLETLKNGFDAFSALNGAVKSYIFTGTPTRTIQNAWCSFCQAHPNIQPGNYYALLQDSVMANEFRKLCSNTYTDGIQKNIETYMAIVGNDDFDEKFKKYLQISKAE